MVLENTGEVIVDRIGIREISIRDAVVYANEVPVKFKGVNRHDSDPVTGFVIGMEQMKKDEAIHVIDYKGILTFRLK